MCMYVYLCVFVFVYRFFADIAPTPRPSIHPPNQPPHPLTHPPPNHSPTGLCRSHTHAYLHIHTHTRKPTFLRQGAHGFMDLPAHLRPSPTAADPALFQRLHRPCFPHLGLRLRFPLVARLLGLRRRARAAGEERQIQRAHINILHVCVGMCRYV